MTVLMTAYTTEIDDTDVAVEEILEQLDLQGLAQNSVGILTCIPEFIESGVVEALTEALPFELVGMTTIGCTTPDSDELDQLSLLVLSSDELRFKTLLSAPLLTSDERIIHEAYLKAADGEDEKPSLILTFCPFQLSINSGDFFVSALDEISEGVPLFGALAIDNTIDYGKSQVISNGLATSNQMAAVLVFGQLAPRFYRATVARKKLADETGIVTRSQGNLLIEVDGKPARDFLLDNGLVLNKDGLFDGLNNFPVFVDYRDNTAAVLRSMLTVRPDGSLICGGDIQEGAILALGYLDDNEVLSSTAAKLAEMQIDANQAILIFSCIGRYFALGYDFEKEARMIHERYDALGLPYTLTYAGGEICPVSLRSGEGELANRLHNNTFIAIVF
jgi:hypothetical protein